MEPPSLINPGRVAKYEYRMSILLPVVERYANSCGRLTHSNDGYRADFISKDVSALPGLTACS